MATSSIQGTEAPPKGDWSNLSPTEKQLNYIRVLGGDPSSVQNKREAADLIDSLVERRKRSPLNPFSLEERGAKWGREAGEDWHSAHYGLLAGLRLDLQQYINTTLDSLRAKLSNSTGPRSSSRVFGPINLARDVKVRLEQLRVWRQHGNPARPPAPPNGIGQSNGRPPVLGPEAVNRSQSERQHDVRSLWNTLAFLIVGEAVLNMFLLMRALPDALLGAFILAFIVSVINVGGIGASVGLAIARFGRGVSRQVGWGLWAILALGFNLIAGRHRAAYARVISEINQNPTVPPPLPSDLLPEVSFNPVSWEFEALLFALLGLLVCGWGFAKGFGFREPEFQDRGDDNPIRPKRTIAGSNHRAHSEYQDVLRQFRKDSVQLREETEAWYETLDQDRRDVSYVVKMLEEKQNRQACVDCVVHAFIAAYNNNHAEKLTLHVVETHRRERYEEPLLVTPSDPKVLDEAAELITKWQHSEREQFEERLSQTQDEVTEMWGKYEPLLFGEHQPNGDGR